MAGWTEIEADFGSHGTPPRPKKFTKELRKWIRIHFLN